MALQVETRDGLFRLVSEELSTGWLPDTSPNRKSVLIFFRLLRDEVGKPLYTCQELSAIVNSENRQASSGYVEHFRACNKDMLAFLNRRKQGRQRSGGSSAGRIVGKALSASE